MRLFANVEPKEPGFFGMLVLIVLGAAALIFPVWILVAVWLVGRVL